MRKFKVGDRVEVTGNEGLLFHHLEIGAAGTVVGYGGSGNPKVSPDGRACVGYTQVVHCDELRLLRRGLLARIARFFRGGAR